MTTIEIIPNHVKQCEVICENKNKFKKMRYAHVHGRTHVHKSTNFMRHRKE